MKRPIWKNAFLRSIAKTWRRHGKPIAVVLSIVLLAQFQPSASLFSDLKTVTPISAPFHAPTVLDLVKGPVKVAGLYRAIVDTIAAPANAQVAGAFQPLLLRQPLTCTGYNSTSTVTGYRLYTFTASGTAVCVGDTTTIQYLVVAAAGSDAGRGGTGAGGYKASTLSLAPGSYAITVGTSTAGNNNGGNSSIAALVVSTGGGAGCVGANTNGGAGGSGGGGCVGTGVGGAASPAGQGNPGGNGGVFSGNFTSAGGGGCSTAGQDGQTLAGGAGGDGCTWSINSTKYACGGGGQADTIAGGAAGCASAGAGAVGDASGGNGQANTGSGAGGSNVPRTAQGGSGIVIIAVPL